MYDVVTGFHRYDADTLEEAIGVAVVLCDPEHGVAVLDESGTCVWSLPSDYAQEVRRLTDEMKNA